MADTDEDLPQADDAIRKDAISLTDAYECIASFISGHPELLPKFDEDCSEALRKSKEEERKIQTDPDAFDKELEEEWHQRKEANLFLRLEIEAKKLVACTRDPETGDILQLRSDNWIPSGWDDYIPPGIWTDYIIPNDYEAPGPNGTFIRGALRPVFFMRDEFEAWFKKTFGATESIVAISEPNPKLQNLKRAHAHRREAVKEAVHAIWGKNEPDLGVTEGIRFKKINDWLEEKGRVTVKEATIRRALRELRSDRS
jgi:hypothetical protein